jgi:hypothetical protein
LRTPAIAFAGGLVIAATPLAAVADQVTLTPQKDNTIFSDPPGTGSNAKGQYLFAGAAGLAVNGALRRGLVQFPLSGIPAGSTVTSVKLTMRLSKAPFGSGNRAVSLHRLTADWGEGTSMAFGNEGTGAPASAGDATWFERFFGSLAWATPGGDFESTASATTLVGDSLVDYTWDSTPALTSDVQSWLSGSAPNDGWILVGDESVPTTARRFNSRENIDEPSRPRLVVTFTPPVPCYANCDGSTTAPALNVADFTCFLQKYAGADPYANCDGSTTFPSLNVADFTCFLQSYAAGCP